MSHHRNLPARLAALVLAALAGILLTACGSSAPGGASAPAPSHSQSASPAPSPSPAPTGKAGFIAAVQQPAWEPGTSRLSRNCWPLVMLCATPFPAR